MSFTAYTQYLTKNDINIYIKVNREIKSTTAWSTLNDEEKELWKDFSSRMTSMHVLSLEYFLMAGNPNDPEDWSDLEGLFDFAKKSYFELMNNKGPKEVNDIFKNAGWRNNGYKKFGTILYGFSILYNKMLLNFLIEKTKMEINMVLENADDEKEREILIWYITTEIDTFIKTDEYYDKLFDLINARDRNIIKTHFNELRKAYEYDFSE
jgi:hypothetical protein